MKMVMKRESKQCIECNRFDKCAVAKGKNPFWDAIANDWNCWEPFGCLMIRETDEVAEPEIPAGSSALKES